MATDSTEQSSPAPEETKFVNKGLRAPFHSPEDPQAYLQKSNHPYAPFTGNALTWESLVFDDGTWYGEKCVAHLACCCTQNVGNRGLK